MDWAEFFMLHLVFVLFMFLSVGIGWMITKAMGLDKKEDNEEL